MKNLSYFFALGFLMKGSQALATVILQQVSPTVTTYKQFIDFNEVSYSPATDITGFLTAVDLPLENEYSTSGCEVAGFASFISGTIAFIKRGDCNFSLKAENAAAAGAIGVLIFNNTPETSRWDLNWTLTDGYSGGIPVFAASWALVNELSKTSNVQIRMISGIYNVPTPSTLALFGLGLAGLGARRFKKQY